MASGWSVIDLYTNFPNLENSGYEITSEVDINYNCIAWASGDTSHCWDPIGTAPYYWPDEAPNSNSVMALVKALETRGYKVCDNGELEKGIEKVAIFILRNEWSHAARQLENGLWTSKMGQLEDISHPLQALVSETRGGYGTPKIFLKRPRA